MVIILHIYSVLADNTSHISYTGRSFNKNILAVVYIHVHCYIILHCTRNELSFCVFFCSMLFRFLFNLYLSKLSLDYFARCYFTHLLLVVLCVAIVYLQICRYWVWMKQVSEMQFNEWFNV